jgi:hypothetical protein
MFQEVFLLLRQTSCKYCKKLPSTLIGESSKVRKCFRTNDQTETVDKDVAHFFTFPSVLVLSFSSSRSRVKYGKY